MILKDGVYLFLCLHISIGYFKHMLSDVHSRISSLQDTAKSQNGFARLVAESINFALNNDCWLENGEFRLNCHHDSIFGHDKHCHSLELTICLSRARLSDHC